ncbi:ATP-grasp ribosomal peptide maturase [Streptomyces europaeiscabiei]|uniref:ATP-grasp ribosomal peptide maturase n=1 Tax=Streptomyces europaeiscabiei TaxID=146819 RepID=UPI0029BC8602|nr:ATP-grasp ribosomal peptide maturase [Streptomyces europaeiscabiei]MDX3613683.1 ATP-grasp ribosomal peptide maturase [Streptomyces europaeiscabiei]
MRQHLSGGPVLVVTKELDPAADLVVDELTIRRVPVMRFDMGDFPLSMSLSVEHAAAPWTGVLADEYRSVRLEEVRAVYYRRPRLPAVSEGLQEPHRTWADEQALAGLLGTLYALPVTWVNRPDVDGIASHKPGQLPVAAAHGLRTPRSLITTDQEVARKFCYQVDGAVICKPLMGGPLEYPDGHRTGVPTHVVDPDTIDDSVSLTAHLFQEWVPKTHEVRLTVVGKEMFAAEIRAGSDAARVDWRSDYDALTYDVCQVPDDVRAGVLSWLEHFRLSFGAFDFAVTPAGDWVMFECNPSGEWSWIQNKTGLPIATHIADLLAGGRP